MAMIKFLIENSTLETPILSRSIYSSHSIVSVTSATGIVYNSPGINDTSASNTVNPHVHNSQHTENIQLPVIPLPEFDGNYYNWLESGDFFESMVNQSTSIT